MAKCTIHLLAVAAQSTYRLKKDNKINPQNETDDKKKQDYLLKLDIIERYGYKIEDSICPVEAGGTGTTPLATACLVPQNDDKSPVVIAYRGTNTMSDVFSDITLGITGVVEKEFRDEAFKFYTDIKNKYPNREIILTGHSLGGNLAQYVASRAYNEDPHLQNQRSIQVRTFNTAPVDTTHSSVFNKIPGLLAQCVNYRLSRDIISNIPLQNYPGNTFVFHTDKGALDSHSMSAIFNSLPEKILEQEVGAPVDNKHERNKKILMEMVNGLLHSYHCSIKGQYFSRFRSGHANHQEMEKSFPAILACIKGGKYPDAITKLTELKDKLKGERSSMIIDVLIKSTQQVYKYSPEAAQKNINSLGELKGQLQDIKLQGQMGQQEEQNQQVTIVPK